MCLSLNYIHVQTELLIKLVKLFTCQYWALINNNFNGINKFLVVSSR